MNRSIPIKLNMLPLIRKAAHNRGLIFGGIILSALLAFEVFNFSSTSFALQDIDRKSTRLNSSHIQKSRMPSSA